MEQVYRFITLSRIMLMLLLITCTGCVSTSINDSIAALKNEARATTVNKEVLMSIQALRATTNIETTIESNQTQYNFNYTLYGIALRYDDRIAIAKLLLKKNNTIVINIAPAKGDNKLQQLSLSMARAKSLRQYIARFSKGVTIRFAPQLTADTLHLVVGA